MAATKSAWTNQETTNLIQAYQDKSYTLKKVPLKSSQWEEVAVTVAARCGYDAPSKTGLQCRHKMEKLRQRYRAEVQLYRPSYWPYFHLMDRLVLGPRPVSTRPMIQNLDDNEDSDDETNTRKSKTMDYLLSTPLVVNRKLNNVATSVTVTEPGEAIDVTSRMVEAEREDTDGSNISYLKLADEIRACAEKFVNVENMRMEMMRETERCRMEMENKRTDMILNSQRRIVDRIGKALGSHKKIKISVKNH